MNFKKISKMAVSTIIAITLPFSLASWGETETSEVSVESIQNLGSSSISYKPGTYTSTQKGLNGNVVVQVTFSENKILSAKVIEEHETDGIADPAFQKIPKTVVDNQTLKVDTVTGATVASEAVIAGITDCVVQAGGNVEALKKVEVAKTVVNKEVTTQVVVVGGGASGTAAGLQAAQNGADVIIVEMTASPAGQGTSAGGLFATNSTLQKEAGIESSNKWVYDQFVKTGNYQVNGGLISKIVQMSGDTVDWLIENGCNLVLAHSGSGGIYEHTYTQEFPTLHGYVDGGKNAITELHKSVTEAGGEVLYNTKATDIIVKDGKVKGIVCETENGTLTINSDVVILATGGFGGNEKLVAETFGEGFGKSRVATNIGTGIEFAQKAGADADFDKAIMMHYGVDEGKTARGSNLNESLANAYLYVDNDGFRFMNEEAFVYEPIKASNVVKSLPQHYAYEIFDSTLIETVAKKGFSGINDLYAGELATDPTVFIEGDHAVDTGERYKRSITPTDLTPDIEKAIADGKIITADTPEELAKKLGMTHLPETIKRYNVLCEQGEDTDHFKSSKYLDKLEGKLYAVKITPTTFLGTLGGIKINENCEVLNNNGKAIQGLYAAGSETSGPYSNTYVYFEGGTLGYAYNTGRIAGTSASSYVESLTK